jgi:hypothetical protein
MGGGGYGNGQIPLERLELIANGTNADGYWEHRLAPGTAARWRALVADVLANEGIRLYISPGWNGYRPLSFQVLAKRKYGRNAAAPGFSSHGGYFEGRESMAVDVGNWGQLGAAKFFAYARKHGFVADYFNGKNGRPLEQWHLIDFDPWTVPASAAATSVTRVINVPKEDNDMRAISKRGVAHSGIIIQPGVPPFSLTDDVYEAVWRAFGLEDVELEGWQYETVIREQWTAFNVIQRFSSKEATLAQSEVNKVADATRDKIKSQYPEAKS